MILPRPGDAFEWHQTPSGPALVCAPLERIARHLFTARPWRLGESRHADNTAWDEVATAFGVERSALVRLRQVHGRTAVVAERMHVSDPEDRAEADIVASGEPERVVVVQVADCVPLLLADRRLGVVAAAHAGWRGLAQRVPEAAVSVRTQELGSQPRDLVAAIGPSIGACCYEVGLDVRQAFSGAGFAPSAIARWFRDAPAIVDSNPPMPGLRSEGRPDHWYFDGWQVAREQLLSAGVDEANIFSAQLCTASHPAVFCSYRRDGTAAGRMAAAIRSPYDAASAGAATTGGTK